MPNLQYNFDLAAPTDTLVDRLCATPGITGVRGRYEFAFQVDTDAADLDAIARLLGHEDFAAFLYDRRPVIYDLDEIAEAAASPYELGNFSSLAEITPDD